MKYAIIMKGNFLIGCIAILFLLSEKNLNAQSNIISKSLQSYVDPFTGDFGYSIPVINITGPNGENYPLILQYKGSGIKMNEESSWVGLGWDLAIGEIARFVNGAADDYKNKVFSNYRFSNNQDGQNWSTSDSFPYYGPVYFNQFPYTTTGSEHNPVMDLYQSDRMSEVGETPFEFPDYDNFLVQTNLIAGRMSLGLFEYASIWNRQGSGYNFGSFPGGDHKAFTKKPQFYFETDLVSRTIAPYYGISGYNHGGTRGYGWQEVNGNSCANNICDMFVESPQTLPTSGISTPVDFSGAYNPTTNQRISIQHIRYFTNAEINNHYSGGASAISGFLDFKSGQSNGSRNSSDFDPDGIGAIQVVDERGFVYHFSLPVYSYDEIDRQFYLTADLSDIDLLDLISTQRKSKYANSWKLTAITGTDYVDLNGNFIPDESDKGYWLYFKYSKWDDNFQWRSPYYGYHYNSISSRFPNEYRNEYSEAYHRESGLVSEGKSELYYIDYIKTKTQTLYFVKDIRLDGVSLPNSSNQKSPKLWIKRILLLDNDDINTSWFESSSTSISSAYFTSLSSTNLNLNTINENQYQANKQYIDPVLLNSVEFVTDYSLCKKVYNNINSIYPTTTRQQSYYPNNNSNNPLQHRFIVEQISGNYSTNETDANKRGKLTLKEVIIRDYQNVQVTPSYLFNYGNDALDNPDFDHGRQDYFGHYKHHFPASRTGYLLPDDNPYVDAWLLKKIILPIGSEITIDYESDVYSGVVYDHNSSVPAPVRRVFKILDVTSGSGGIRLDFQDDHPRKLIGSNFSNATIYYKSTSGNCASNNSLNGTWFSGNSTSIQVTTPLQGNCISNCINCIGDVANTSAYFAFNLSEALGGGVRVKSISIKDPNSPEIYSLFVKYKEGIATNEPDPFGRPGFNLFLNNSSNGNDRFALTLSKYGSDRHALSPAVGYSFVEFEHIGSLGTLLGKDKLHMYNYFDAFRRQSFKGQKTYPAGFPADFDTYSKWEVIQVIENNSLFGKVISDESYDGFGTMVSKASYEYSNSANTYEGIVQEVFYKKLISSRNVDLNPNDQEGIELKTVFLKEKRNSYIVKKTVFLGNTELTTSIFKRDPITGEPIGIKNESNSVPTSEVTSHSAYRNPNFDVLGPKSQDDGNLNLLTGMLSMREKRGGHVVDGKYFVWSNSCFMRSYDGSNIRMTTSNQTVPWLQKDTYVFDGDPDSTTWPCVERVTLLDPNFNILERRNFAGQYSANRVGYSNEFVLSSAQNASYSSYTYCGFESVSDFSGNIVFDGDIFKNGGVHQLASSAGIGAHTGSYVLKLNSGSSSRYKEEIYSSTIGADNIVHGVEPGRKYAVIVWVHNSSPSNAQLEIKINGILSGSAYNQTYSINKNDPSGIQIGNWIRLKIEFEIPSNLLGDGTTTDDFQINLKAGTSGTTYFDDLLFRPVDGSVEGFVFDTRRKLPLFSIDNEGFFSRFVYDNSGSVTETYRETHLGEKKIVSKNYHFVR